MNRGFGETTIQRPSPALSRTNNSRYYTMTSCKCAQDEENIILANCTRLSHALRVDDIPLVQRFGGRLKETSLAVCSPEGSSWFCNSSFWGRAKDPSFLRLLGSVLSSLPSVFSSASLASSLSLLGDAVGSFDGAMPLSATGSSGGGDGVMPLSATGSGGGAASLSVGASIPAFLLPLHPITPTQD
jgi:hypothetical protein